MRSLCSRPMSYGLYVAVILMALLTPFHTSAKGLPRASPAPNTEYLSYDAALELALTRSIDTQRANLGIDLAAADVAVLSHENDPRLVLSDTLSEMRPNATNLLGNTIANANRSGTTAILQLSGMIYDFGRHAARLAQSENQKDLRSLTHEETLLNIRYRVARGYTSLVSAERAFVVAGEQVKITQAKLEQQRLHYKRGLRSESEVLAAEMDLGRANLVLSRAKAEIRSVRQTFASLLNVQEELVYQKPLPSQVLELKPPEKTVLLLARWGDVIQKNPRDQRREKEAEALVRDEDLVRSMQRPTLTGSISAQHLMPWNGAARNVYLGQMQLSWDIPWNGMARDERHRISLRRRDLALLTESERNDRKDQDARARLTLENAAVEWQSSKNQASLAERQRELVQRRYDSGKASALELTSAEAELLTQRLELVRLQNTMTLALIDLAEARGVKDLRGVFQ
jgi:outer membrane protein TolC